MSTTRRALPREVLRLELDQEVRPAVLQNRARSAQRGVLRTLEVELHERESISLCANDYLVERTGHDLPHGPGARPVFGRERAECRRVALEHDEVPTRRLGIEPFGTNGHPCEVVQGDVTDEAPSRGLGRLERHDLARRTHGGCGNQCEDADVRSAIDEEITRAQETTNQVDLGIPISVAVEP